jgi:hypothetical protein
MNSPEDALDQTLVVVGLLQVQLVVDDLAEPLTVAVEYESIDAHLLISGYTDALNQAFLVTECAQSAVVPGHLLAPYLRVAQNQAGSGEEIKRRGAAIRKQPTIPSIPLPHILRSRPINEELGVIEDVRHALHSQRAKGRVLVVVVAVVAVLESAAAVGQGLEAVALAALEVVLEVEVRVAVLAVDGAALVGDLLDLGAADGGGLGVRGLCGAFGGAGGVLGCLFGVLVLRDDGCCWWVGVLVVSMAVSRRD